MSSLKMKFFVVFIYLLFLISPLLAEQRKVVIIGSGPAAYTAAIYCSRAMLNPLLFEGMYSGVAGGQLMTTTDVENFPGFPEGISGPELMFRMKRQAEKFGTECIEEDVISIECSQRPFLVTSNSKKVYADCVIVATGATAKGLDIKGTHEDEFWQNGVSACALCDGAMPMFRDKELYVIGGGDSAIEEGIYLTRYASHVYIVHRRDQLRASKIMADRAKAHPKITILWDSLIEEVSGSDVVTAVTVKNVKTGKLERRKAAGVFFGIGHEPNSKFLNGQLLLDTNGYIILSKDSQMSSVKGVYAAGDVHDHLYRQAIVAAGAGCRAAIEVERELTLLQTDK